MGIRDGVPIALGYLAVSFAFGLSAVLMGLSVLEALLISLFNVTSAGQLAGTPIIAASGSFAELISSQLVINSRYSLMSVSLSQRLGPTVRMRDRFYIAFVNTDEVFAVASGKPGAVGRKYMLGLIVPPVLGWCTGTLLGAIAGDVLPPILVTSLSVSMYAMFIAIITPAARESVPTLLCILAAIAMSVVFYFVPLLSAIPDGFVIIIIALSVSALFALLFPIPNEDDAARDGEVAE